MGVYYANLSIVQFRAMIKPNIVYKDTTGMTNHMILSSQAVMNSKFTTTVAAKHTRRPSKWNDIIETCLKIAVDKDSYKLK